MSPSEIKQFYKNQTVFITGGTGFIGKLLIEKLLRVCEPKKITVIVRPKKGKSVEERIDDFFNYACFDRLKNEFKDYKRKVCFISGDCEADNLGISKEDEEVLIQETTIVFHVAANVKFDQSLQSAANANVKSTVNILTLAKKMPLLKAFIYVSTAYSNCIHKEIKEDFYTPPMTYKNLFGLLDATNKTTLEKITPKLLGEWPNTYIYSKSISEDVVKTLGNGLPIAIVRPAIVVTTLAEPMPGWIDNMYGIIGIGIGAGVGIINTVRALGDAVAYFVPADFVANLGLAAAWSTQNQKQITIYNFVGHKNNLITYRRFHDTSEKLMFCMPPEKILWKNSFTRRENKLWNDICIFFLHTLPAYIIDFILFCLGKPRIAVIAYKKLNKLLELTSYFAIHNWIFEDKNLIKLWENMVDEDKKLFNFDMEKINWPEMCRIGFFGFCLHLLKVPAVENPKFTMKHAVLYVAHYTVILLFWFLIYKLITFLLCLLTYI